MIYVCLALGTSLARGGIQAGSGFAATVNPNTEGGTARVSGGAGIRNLKRGEHIRTGMVWGGIALFALYLYMNESH